MLNRHVLVFAKAHNRALAELFFNLRNRCFQRLVLVYCHFKYLHKVIVVSGWLQYLSHHSNYTINR